ncbi:hypothetical protein ACHAXM_011044 [Skeletonema potamos]|jgi:hypothetical protein
MADEARAMLDALMGADRNAPVEGASGIGSSGSGAAPRGRKKSCYDNDVCPLYCAWSLSSQENPTWAETVAANEGAGGIDVFDLFTNTKSDIGPNPYRVDDHAREEFASLPDHEKRRLGYEEMLARKLLDLVRQCDRLVARNKEKLRREVAQAMKQRTGGRGNREDLIVTVNEEMLNDCAANVAKATLIEEEMADLVEKLQGLESEEQELLKVLSEEAEKKKEEDKEKEPPKKKKKKSKDKDASAEIESAQTPTNDVDPRLLEMQKRKLTTLLHIQSLSLQLPPLRDITDNLLRQLQYLRSDTSTDKVVCEVSGNFMSSRDADERIAAHYAGKQYIGWKLVREKLKELQKRGFGMGESHSHGRGGGGYNDGYNNRRGVGGHYDNRGGHQYDDRRGGGHYGGGGGGYHRNERGHGGGRNDRDYRSRDYDRYDRRGRW